MEQKWQSRNKPIHLCSTDFWQISQDNSIGENFSTNGALTTEYPHAEEWSWIPTLYPTQIGRAITNSEKKTGEIRLHDLG